MDMTYKLGSLRNQIRAMRTSEEHIANNNIAEVMS